MGRIDGRSETRYSDRIEGTAGNWNKPVRFDWTTQGFVGITQWADAKQTHVDDRVLLTKEQVRQLIAFIKRRGYAR